MRKKFKVSFFFWLTILLPYSHPAANPWTHLRQGDEAAQDFLDQMDQKKAEAGPHPFYKGISKESKFKDADLKRNAPLQARRDPASRMIRESSESRPQIKIDPQKDPLMTGAHKIMANPLEEIGDKGTHAMAATQGGKDETLTCEEPGDDSPESCYQNLIVKLAKTKVRKEWTGNIHFWMENGAIRNGAYLACPSLREEAQAPQVHEGEITAAYKACMQELGNTASGGCVELSPLGVQVNQIQHVRVERRIINSSKPWRIKNRFYTNCSSLIHNDIANRKSWYDCRPLITIVYEEDSYTVLPDEWASNCDRLEERVDQGLCHYASKECTQGKQTRIIDGIPITRDCWQEKLTYHCEYPAKDDCGPLRARRCVQINSKCKQKVGNTCVAYTQTYQCKGQTRTAHSIQGGKTPFCLDGNCRDQSFEANDEMMTTLAQLSLLKDMQGSMDSIFKGEAHQCSKYVVHFKDCCGSGKGWGKSIGLGGCHAGEKLLHEKRKNRLCHYVGTYCAKKVLGKCVKKNSSFCCFGSKLLKAFHEQGRSQIGMGWGDGEHPLCRGFTIEEIKDIDFSKLDLSEAFEDLMKNYTPSKLQGTDQKIGERMEVIKQGMAPPHQKQKMQRPEA